MDAASGPAFADFAPLLNAKGAADVARAKGDEAERLGEAAQQFESLFINMMLTAARATEVLSKDNPLTSFETKMQSQLLDQQWSSTLSENGGIGLAKMMVQQLSPQRIGPAVLESAAATASAQVGMDIAAGFAMPDTTTSIKMPGTEAAVAFPIANFVRSSLVTGAQVSSDEMTASPHMAPAGIVVPAPAAVASAVDATAGSVTDPVKSAPQAPERAEYRGALFSSPSDFVQQLLPIIKQKTAGTPFAPLGVLAQAALETGWGKHVIAASDGGSSNNLFGIKASSSWSGATATVPTLEVQEGVARREHASFKVFADVAAAVEDVVSLLRDTPRYAPVRASAQDAAAYAEGLQRAGYATDPHYADKLVAILQGPTLRALLDEAVGDDAEATEQHEQQTDRGEP